jgi:ankyrin repeat protein
LVGAGANLDLKNGSDWPPIHLAACWGRTEAAEILLKAGANPNLTNENGHTALEVARIYQKEGIADLIQGYGGMTANEVVQHPTVEPRLD